MDPSWEVNDPWRHDPAPSISARPLCWRLLQGPQSPGSTVPRAVWNDNFVFFEEWMLLFLLLFLLLLVLVVVAAAAVEGCLYFPCCIPIRSSVVKKWYLPSTKRCMVHTTFQTNLQLVAIQFKTLKDFQRFGHFTPIYCLKWLNGMKIPCL